MSEKGNEVLARVARQDEFQSIVKLWKRLVTEEKDAVDKAENLDFFLFF